MEAIGSRHISIRVYVSGLFIILTLAVGFSLAVLFLGRMKDALAETSSALFDRTATIVADDVAAQRAQIASSLAFAVRSELARAADPADRGEALAVLAEMLENDWVAAAYAGYPNGDFLLLRRAADSAALRPFPAGTRFALQRVDRAAGHAQGSYVFYDLSLRVKGRRPAPGYRFDPRGRPWYLAARSGGISVTPPYVFFTTRRIGVTMSLRSATGSVIGNDIDLASVSQQLVRLRPTPSSQAAIVERDGAVLATTAVGSFGGRAPALAALNAPPLNAAFARAGSGLRAQGAYRDASGRSWVFRVSPVLGQSALLLAVPTDELYAAAERARSDAMLLGIVLVVFWIPCALWLARFIAVPLIALREEALALRNQDFTDRPRQHSMISEIDELAGTFAAMRSHVREYNESASRFVPREFLKQLQRSDILSLQLGDHAERTMTILFSDIRSFTTLSESMSPQQTFNFVNSYLTRVGPIVRNHHGFIDKYIGDAIMGLFPEEAQHAIDAAIAMQRRVVVYNEERARAGYAPIRIGVGLHCGRLMLGTIGETERFETTVIADAVNVASRLEGLTKTFGSLILASDEVVTRIDASRYRMRRLADVQVLGTSRGVTLYEICDADPDAMLAHKERTAERFEQARLAYAAGAFAAANEAFAEVAADDEDDHAAAYFRDRAATLEAATALPLWDGVERLDSK